MRKRLNARALALRAKPTKRNIDHMLSARPDLHDSVVAHLASMGCPIPTKDELHQGLEESPAAKSAASDGSSSKAPTSMASSAMGIRRAGSNQSLVSLPDNDDQQNTDCR